MSPLAPPQPDTILSGPYWPVRIRVIAATVNGGSMRVQGVGLEDGDYYDRMLTVEQYERDVVEESGELYSFDSQPKLFRLAVEALRTKLAHAFDPEFAVSVSQVDPLPHQLDAVYRHILPLPRIRFLLADDPGAGKTIMAGLLMRELMQRQGIERVLVLCPKALTDQWRREMWERFRERFTLLTGDVISHAFGQNAWVEHDLVIASVDLAVQDHIRPGIEQSHWDLIIFDEAHKLSAYRYGSAGKIDKTKRYQIAETLAPRTKHLLLMTATPHRGDDENFRLLLSLLDPTVFATQRGMLRAIRRDGSPYFLRRMKESMRHFDGRKIFLPRHVETVAYPLESHEQDLYDAVTDYVATGLDLAEQTRNRNVGLAMTVLQRRLASSLYAITRSLERRRDRLSDEFDQARISGRFSDPRVQIDFDPDDDEDLRDLTDDEEEALSRASNARTADELEAEIALLHDLIDKARRTRTAGPERKLREFRQVVEGQLTGNTSEKFLVFTEHTDTLTYLTNKLREWGYSVCNIHGGMRLQDRIDAEKEFRGPTQFLVATDAAGEGINLQFCRLMINWDLPWNPNRLEQRMGRIHRYGQQYEVSIFNLVANTTREGAVLERLMIKLARMRDAMGEDQVYDVIASVLDGGQIKLEALIKEAIRKRRSIDEMIDEIDIIDTDTAIAVARSALSEALATDHIDMSFINAEQRESKERRLTPEYVERFFVDALTYLTGRIAAGNDRDWRLEYIPAEIRKQARAANTGELGREQRIITFHKERLRDDPPAEFVAPDHPLFDAVVDKLLEPGRPALAQGTVFMDDNAREPYLVWLLEAGAINGERETVHRRLLALRQVNGTFEQVSPGVLLDLPPADTAPLAPQGLVAGADPEAAISAANGYYTGDYYREVSVEQERRVEIVEQALRQSVGEELDRLQQQLERQYADAERGRDMRLALQTTNREIEELTTDLERRRMSLARQQVISIETPRVVGVAAVIPGITPKVWGRGGDQSETELAAMAVAAEYERRSGREPEDVSRRGVGYDIRSAGQDGDVRYIEVKGHRSTGDITLYYTEWQTAHRMRDEFFIYIVDYTLSDPQLRIVQDPVGKGIEPAEKVVEYRITQTQVAAATDDIERIGQSNTQ